MIKQIEALILGLLALASGTGAPYGRAEAAAGPDYYEGITAIGAFPCVKNDVIMEKQVLTLHIGELPAFDENDSVGYAVSDTYMTSEYTIKNPTDRDVSLKMLFPCSGAPRWLASEEGSYSVLSDGEPVESVVRHSYSGYYNRTFDLESGIYEITAGQIPDSFYRRDLPVHEYRFRVEFGEDILQSLGRKYLAFVLSFDCDAEHTRVMSSGRMNTDIVNGKVRASFDVGAGSNQLSLVVVGEDIDHLTFGLYPDRYGVDPLEGNALFYAESDTDFFTYAMRFYPEGSEISEDDWYAGFVRMLSSETVSGCIAYAIPSSLREEAFMQWREYTLSIPARTTVKNVVKAPLYPTIERNPSGDPDEPKDRYVYSYLLSSGRYWSRYGAHFDEIEIRLETPFYLAASSLDFESRGDAYIFRREGLPLGELSFTLTGTESGYISGGWQYGTYDPISPSLRLAMLLLIPLGIVIAAIAVFAIVYRVRRRRKK